MWTSPEGDEVGVAEDGTEEGEQELPHLRVPLHVPPPDLGQQRLEDEEGMPCYYKYTSYSRFKNEEEQWVKLLKERKLSSYPTD